MSTALLQVERLCPKAVDWSWGGGAEMPPWGEPDKPDAYDRYLRSIKRLAGCASADSSTGLRSQAMAGE